MDYKTRCTTFRLYIKTRDEVLNVESESGMNYNALKILYRNEIDCRDYSSLRKGKHERQGTDWFSRTNKGSHLKSGTPKTRTIVGLFQAIYIFYYV